MWSKLFGKKKVSLEDQLVRLKEIGFDLNPGFSKEHLLSEFDRSQFEKDPYRLLLVAMGGDIKVEDEKWVPISNKVWHFDTECIEDHGDYIRIAHRLRDLAEGNLPITNVRDYVDVDGGQAWVSFELDGKENKWNLKVEDDWVDPDLFTKFVELLSFRGRTKRFIIMSLGQDCLLAWADTDQLQRLNELPGLKFELLK